MNIRPASLDGLMIITQEKRADARGFFIETFNKERLNEHDIDVDVMQTNLSRSKKGVIRGLHFQWDKPLGKLIRVARGSTFMAAVDIRRNSPTLGKWESFEISDDGTELWAPAGFAMGFCALEDDTEIEYHYTALYNQQGESSIRWNDPKIGITWPSVEPILSERDAQAQTFEEWLARPESDKFRI